MRTLLPGLILLIGLACGGNAEETAEAPERPARKPTPVPTLTRRASAGPPKTVDATRLRQELTRSSDGPRVYNFWATWCPPCIAEMPLLRSFAIAQPDVDVVFVNVDAKSLHNTRVTRLIREHALTDLPHLLLDAEDPLPLLAEAVPEWPAQIPVTLVVDRTGREAERFTQALSTPDLLEAVARAR